MSNEVLNVINKFINHLGLQIGSPLWYELVALSITGVKEVHIEPSNDQFIDATLRFAPEDMSKADTVKQDLIKLFESDDYHILGHRIEIKCAYYE